MNNKLKTIENHVNSYEKNYIKDHIKNKKRNNLNSVSY